jgi:hypothetical protein
VDYTENIVLGFRILEPGTLEKRERENISVWLCNEDIVTYLIMRKK